MSGKRSRFVMVPVWLLDEVAEQRIPPAAIATFVSIASRSTGSTGNGSHPGQGTVAAETHQSVRTVRDHIRLLEKVGALRAVKRHNGRGHRTSDGYTVSTGDRLPTGSEEPVGHAIPTGSESPVGDSALPAVSAPAYRQPRTEELDPVTYTPPVVSSSVGGEAGAGFRGDLTSSSSHEQTFVTNGLPGWDAYVADATDGGWRISPSGYADWITYHPEHRPAPPVTSDDEDGDNTEGIAQ